MDRPNILIIYTDQQRWDTIAAGGHPYMHTPNLDRLAENGALFDHCFCNSPACMPSRQSMLSGQYSSTIGSYCNGIEMNPAVPTLPELLKPYGYVTGNLGKLHFKNHSNRDHREPHPHYGFDTLILSDEPGCYDDAYIKWVENKAPAQIEKCRCATPPCWSGPAIAKPERDLLHPYSFAGDEQLTHTAFVVDETITFIEKHRDESWLAIAGIYAPHPPVNPPQRFIDMYNTGDLESPHFNEGEDKNNLSEKEWQQIKAHYYGLISHVDDQAGRLIAALDRLGQRGKTLIIFTSDHGEHLGDHGLEGKGLHYDSCSRVPLIISHPNKIRKNHTYNQLVEHVDLLPTILDYCTVQLPPALQGRSLRPLLEGDKSHQERSSAFIEMKHPFEFSFKAVRTHDYAYCRWQDGREELFDMIKDPHQLRDVCREKAYEDALNRMRSELLTRWYNTEKQYPLRSGHY